MYTWLNPLSKIGCWMIYVGATYGLVYQLSLGMDTQSQPQASITSSNCSWPHHAVAADQPLWIHTRPTTDCRHQGWAIPYISVLSEMCSICRQPLYGVILTIVHTNKSCVVISDQNLEIFLSSFKKFPMLRDTVKNSFVWWVHGWKNLHQDNVDATSVEAFKNRLNKP